MSKVRRTQIPSALRDTAGLLRANPQELVAEVPDLCEQAAQEIIDLREYIDFAHARIEALRATALKYVDSLTDPTISDTEQAIDKTLERHGDRHAQVQGVYPALLFAARNAIKTMRLARDRARKELAAANEARQKAERERDVARENARVRSGEALDYYSAMLNFAHEFGAKDGDNMIEVICNGIDALRADVKRLRETLANPPRHQWWGAGEPDCPPDIKGRNGELIAIRCKICGASDAGRTCRAAIDAARKEA